MDDPQKKSFRAISFIAHATRGLIHDQNARRKTMFIVLLIALVLLFSGSTFFQLLLDPREHPARFIFFWFICGWLAMTAILLAIFDMLMVRAEGRKAERVLRSRLSPTETPDSPRSTTPKQSGLAKPFGVDE